MLTKFDFKYSLKNIPIPGKDTYLKGLISATETFIQNLRWKTFHLLNRKKNNKNEVNNYGFKTPKNAPYIQQLEHFENDLNHLISNLEFEENNNVTKGAFQTQLSKDVRRINK